MSVPSLQTSVESFKKLKFTTTFEPVYRKIVKLYFLGRTCIAGGLLAMAPC